MISKSCTADRVADKTIVRGILVPTNRTAPALPPDAENQTVVVICVETQEADVRFEPLDG